MHTPDQPDEDHPEMDAELGDVAAGIVRAFEDRARREALAALGDPVERWVREQGLNVLPFPAKVPTRDEG